MERFGSVFYAPFDRGNTTPISINNNKTAGQNPMEKVFIEEADVIFGKPAFIALSAHQTSHNFCKPEKKKSSAASLPHVLLCLLTQSSRFLS